MPTARELLEQADALMRKGRGTAGHAPAPPSPAAVWPPFVPGATSPRTIQREPIAPSEALTSAPSVPDTSAVADLTAEIALPAVEAPDLAAAVDAAQVAPVEVPTLSEAVSDIELDGEVPAAAGLEGDADDFPVLTDAVDAAFVATTDEGSRAPWEARGTVEAVEGQPPSAPSEPSAPRSASEESVEPGADIPIAGFTPLGPQPAYDIRLSVDFEDVALAAPREATTGNDVGAALSVAEGELADTGTMPEVSLVDIEAVAPAGGPEQVGGERDEDERIDEAGIDEAGIDEARIDEAVDAIRMQVLQRIDIFTDTTLRARLGEELRPLVERASGELVTAINQHVGEWLRTYVAEVLEQEIERWRNGQR